MRKIILQIFLTIISLSFVSCSSEKNEATYFDYTNAWQDAYSALLSKYYNATTHLPAEESWLFTLHDINGDGVPELFIWEPVVSFFFAIHSAYTFFDGEAHQLEIADSFGGNPSSLSIFSRPDNTPGMIVNGHGELFWRHMLISMKGNSLAIDVCFTGSVLPRDRGYDDVLYYIKGLDVVPVELPDFLYWLIEEHERMTSEGYALVSQEEFFRLRDIVFGSMLEADGSRPRPLTDRSQI